MARARTSARRLESDVCSVARWRLVLGLLLTRVALTRSQASQTQSASRSPTQTTSTPALVVGNLITVQVQVASKTATAATAVSFVELNTSGVTVRTLAVPSTGASACTLSALASKDQPEGKLFASADYSAFSFACYMAAAGTSSVSTSSSVTRAGAVSVGVNPAAVWPPVTSSQFASQNVYGAAMFDSATDSYYMHGVTGSNAWDVINVGPTGSGTTSVYGTTGSPYPFYAFVIYASTLYASTSTRGIVRIGTTGALPTTSGATVTPVGTTVGGSAETLTSFHFQNSTWLWACTIGGNAGQGVARYILSAPGGTFTNPYTSSGTWQWFASDCLDITGQIEPSGLYFLYWVSPATSGTNTLVYRMGATAGAAATAIATSTFQFRGIKVVGAPVMSLVTPSQAPTPSSSPSSSQALTPSSSQTPSQAPTPSSSRTATSTMTPSVSATWTATPSRTPSPQLGGYIITTVVGVGGVAGATGGGGVPTAALFYGTDGMTYAAGIYFVVDRSGNTVRSVVSGVLATVAGTLGAAASYGGDGNPATAATVRLSAPSGVAGNATRGLLWIADSGNNCVRAVTLGGGVISTFAGSGGGGGSFCGDGGQATSACLSGPTGLLADYSGGLFILDVSLGTGGGRCKAGASRTLKLHPAPPVTPSCRLETTQSASSAPPASSRRWPGLPRRQATLATEDCRRSRACARPAAAHCRTRRAPARPS